MVKAQEWLDREYPKENRSEITELDISKQQLEGDLDLTGFVNLKEVFLGYNSLNITNIDINSESLSIRQSLYIDYRVSDKYYTIFNTQKWLDKNYPRYGLNKEGQKRSEVRKLGVGNSYNSEHYMGFLKLTDFTNLEELYFPYHSNLKLTELDLSDCLNLQILDCSITTLTDLVLPNSVKLKSLRLFNCSSLKKDLMFFSRLANLESLSIWYSGIYGSLKSLKNLTKLNSLDISGTNIGSGLEYLSESLDKIRIYCHDEKNWGVKKIQEQLREYVDLRSGDYLLNPWRENNAQLVNKVKTENNNYQREVFNQRKEIELIPEEKETSRKEKSVSSVATQTDLTALQITELEELKAQIQALVNK